MSIVNSESNFSLEVCRPTSFSSKSRFPSVGVSEDGKRAVVVCHGALNAYSMYYCIGKILHRRIEWNEPRYLSIKAKSKSRGKWYRYYYPKVVVTNNGTVIVAYGKIPNAKTVVQRCCYLIGNIVNEDTIEWENEQKFDRGSNGSITINEHQSFVSVAFCSISINGLTLNTRRAILNTTSDVQVLPLEQVKPRGLRAGIKEVSIAMNQHFMVFTFVTYHIRGPKIHTMIGRLLDNGHIEMNLDSVMRIGQGKSPSVSMNQSGLAVLMYESYSGRVLKCSLGVVDQTTFSILWSNPNDKQSLCYGCYPSVYLLNSNVLVEVHSAHIGTRLLSLVGEILCMSSSQEVSTHEFRHENSDEPQSLDTKDTQDRGSNKNSLLRDNHECDSPPQFHVTESRPQVCSIQLLHVTQQMNITDAGCKTDG